MLRLVDMSAAGKMEAEDALEEMAVLEVAETVVEMMAEVAADRAVATAVQQPRKKM